MKFREHRGSLAASMETVVELEPTKSAVIAHAKKLALESGFPFTQEELDRELTLQTVRVEAYGPDARIGWDTYLVCSTYMKIPILGFTNSQLKDE
jgi:hypothetical protein